MENGGGALGGSALLYPPSSMRPDALRSTRCLRSEMPTPPPSLTDPYDALAAGYDVVMAHVDYGGWADYVLGLFETHRVQPRSVLELGCGTGSFALDMQEHGPEGGFHYLGIDRSATMIRVAKAKAEMAGRSAGDLRFAVADFTETAPAEAGPDERFDAVLLLYDGLNYLLEDEAVAALFAGVASALAPGGVAIVDQSTPVNSLNNEAYFEDEGEADRFAYVRRSHYDPERRLHTTEFDLTIDGRTYAEQHVQRAYARAEIAALIAASPLTAVAAYDGFTTASASDDSERIHWVLQKTNDEL